MGRPSPLSSQLQIQIQISTQYHQKAQARAGNQKHTIFNDFFQNKTSILILCFIQQPLHNIHELVTFGLLRWCWGGSEMVIDSLVVLEEKNCPGCGWYKSGLKLACIVMCVISLAIQNMLREYPEIRTRECWWLRGRASNVLIRLAPT